MPLFCIPLCVKHKAESNPSARSILEILGTHTSTVSELLPAEKGRITQCVSLTVLDSNPAAVMDETKCLFFFLSALTNY